MKVIKFIKDHFVGFTKGQVKEVNESLALRFIEEGYAEESTNEELKKYLKSAKPNDITGPYAKFKQEVNKTVEAKKEEECEECDEEEPCLDCELNTKTVKQLKAIAEEEGIEGFDSLKKAELVAAIKEVRTK